MRKISATRSQGICTVILLSLTLLLGFTTPPLRYNQERQAAPTELVSRKPSQDQTVTYPSFKNNFQLHFFISFQEIVTRLGLFDLKVKIKLAENLKSEMLAKRIRTALRCL